MKTEITIADRQVEYRLFFENGSGGGRIIFHNEIVVMLVMLKGFVESTLLFGLVRIRPISGKDYGV